VVTYKPGRSSSFIDRTALDLLIEESRKSAFKSGEQWEVLRREEGAVIVGKKGVEKQQHADKPIRAGEPILSSWLLMRQETALTAERIN